jgi:glycosyltransferase involved in cell wall biosynthesis
MKQPFFSILIPVYNVEKYMNECLDSIIAQTFDDYEVIIVDDGSTDNSGKICDSYKEKFGEKLRVVHKQNEGLIAARRISLKHAIGKYIVIVDSDDYIRSDMLSGIYGIIEKNKPDIVMFEFQRVDFKGNNIKNSKMKSELKSGFVSKEEVFERIISSSRYNTLWSKVYRMELFDVDKNYSEYYNIKNGEDLLQLIPLLSAANKFYYLPEKFYFYRINPSSITHNYNNQCYKSLNVVRPLLYKHLEILGYDTEKNKQIFYKFYLEVVLENICEISINANKKQAFELFSEIESYEFVIKAKEYIGVLKSNILAQIGINLFYKHHWNAFIKYVKMIRKYRYLK